MRASKTLDLNIADDGLPAGLQIVGRHFEDATVLKAASDFEQASRWADKRPQLSQKS